jgi:2-succinyl-6-hydroxy-2,4-cyclohexadiene-1-carboxylate synthase
VPVVLVPGFGQPASMWNPVLEHVRAHGTDATAVEIPGGLSFPATAARLAADVDGPVVWVGYSLGARLALQVVLDHPAEAAGLVMVSGTAGIEHVTERATRAADDNARARAIERDGVEAFMDAWLAQPLFADLPPEAARRAERIAANSPERLTHQLRALGQGAMEPLWARLGEIRVPFVAIAGGSDEKYAALAARLAASVADGRSAFLDGGHALPLTAPAPVAALITAVARHP